MAKATLARTRALSQAAFLLGGRYVNFYKHHIGDYDSATAHLTWLEDMAYTRLIRLYYRREEPLPPELARVCKLVRAATKDERAAVETVLAEFFTLAADGWHNSRCDGEIEAALAKAEKNREVGKSGGRPRKTETTTVSENNHDGFVSEPTNNPSQTPDSRLQTKAEPASQDLGTAGSASPPDGGKPENPVATDYGVYAAELRNQGMTVTSMNGVLAGWVRDGIALELLVEATQLAKVRLGDKAIKPGYVDAMVRDPTFGKPQGVKDRWWTTNQGINRKAVELGITVSPSDTYDTLRERCFEASKTKTNGATPPPSTQKPDWQATRESVQAKADELGVSIAGFRMPMAIKTVEQAIVQDARRQESANALGLDIAGIQPWKADEMIEKVLQDQNVQRNREQRSAPPTDLGKPVNA